MTNWDNMLALADYLDSLPEGYEHFSMDRFSTWDRPEDAVNDCGTVACAIGHGPMALRQQAAEFQPRPEEYWVAWAERVFTDDFNLWRWCFDRYWVVRDNTTYGAAARIRWAHKHGAPKNWQDQLFDDSPLCYRTEVAS